MHKKQPDYNSFLPTRYKPIWKYMFFYNHPKVFGYWIKMYILLMENWDQPGQK